MSLSADLDGQTCQRRWMAVVAITGLASSYTLLRGKWPEVFTFVTDPSASLIQRLLSAPVHLADDVMVTVRSGEMILETGAPVFNRDDVAQAATSYVAPYLFAVLRLVLPFHAAVVAFAAVGFIAVAATFAVIAGRSRSLINAALLVGALALTQTNLEFALNGWDHLLQGLMFAFAIALVLAGQLSPRRLVAVSLLAAVGSVARPDGVIIGAAILLVALIRSRADWRRALAPTLLPYLIAVAIVLGVNLLQFGHLTPTTARLKTGAAPSLTYARDYLFANGIESYTAFTLTVILGIVTLLCLRRLPAASVLPLLIAALATATVAALNSDFFPGARMFWVSAVVLAATLAVTLPGVLRAGPAFSLDEKGRIATRMRPVGQWAVVIALVGVTVAASAALGLRGAVVSTEALPGSRTAQQYLATQWIEENLSPEDGPVGVFYAGEAAHLTDFEAADFLGKADELIAAVPVVWGPPGHNKWDIDATLDKWRPQVILPTIDQDPRDASADALAEEWRDRKWTHGYLADLITNPTIRADYRYCRVPDPTGFTESSVDVYLRIDVVDRLGDATDCRP